MEGKQPKFLFLPVSDATGIGEYMRSVIIADEIVRLYPEARIHFLLSREAPYASSCPYPATLLDDSPTLAVGAVCDFISDFSPDVVLFDASGRRSQLAHAKRCGARVIFISQHARKRRRGMKLSRARLTDVHWVAQPEFAIAPVSGFSRNKLKLFRLPQPVATGPFFSRPTASHQQALLEQYGLERDNYWLVNAGSGAHQLQGQPAVLKFAEAASASFASSQVPALVVLGPGFKGETPSLPGVTFVPSLGNRDFINLLEAARGALLSGGDGLLQAIALKKPCLAVAVAKDQPLRIAACMRMGLVVGSEADAIGEGMVLLNAKLPELKVALSQHSCGNGLDYVGAELPRLLDWKHAG